MTMQNGKSDMTMCAHEDLAPKQHPDGPIAPACIKCGKFVVRGELHIVVDPPTVRKTNG